MTNNELAKKLGYIDEAHLEMNLDSYDHLDIWWAVLKEVNDLKNMELSSQSIIESPQCGDLMKHNWSIVKIGRCIPCDRLKDNL